MKFENNEAEIKTLKQVIFIGENAIRRSKKRLEELGEIVGKHCERCHEETIDSGSMWCDSCIAHIELIRKMNENLKLNIKSSTSNYVKFKPYVNKSKVGKGYKSKNINSFKKVKESELSK